METAFLRLRDLGPLGDFTGGGSLGGGSLTFPRSARCERVTRSRTPSPKKQPPPTPTCDCCPYGYHIDLDFVRYCERLAAGAARGSPGAAANRARRRDRRRQRQSMDVLLGLVEPLAEVQVANTENTPPQLQWLGPDFFRVLCKESYKPAPPPPRRRQKEPEMPQQQAKLDADLYEFAEVITKDHSGPAGTAPALQNIREQMARSLERMRELEEEVKIIPVLKVQLSVAKEEKRKMLLQMKTLSQQPQPVLKENGINILKILEGPVERLAEKPARRSVRDIGVGCTVLTRDVGVMPPPARLRSVGTTTWSTEPAAPRLGFSSVWTQNIPETPASSQDTRGCQTEPQSCAECADRASRDRTRTANRACRHVQTDLSMDDIYLAPAPPAQTRDFGAQVQEPQVARVHVGVSARPAMVDSTVTAAPKTRDAASSECSVSDVMCEKCNVRKRTIGVEALLLKEEDPVKRVCLSSLSQPRSATPSPAPSPTPSSPKPSTRSVGCGTAGERLHSFTVHRATNTTAPITHTSNRSTNTDPSSGTCRATNTDPAPQVLKKDVSVSTPKKKLVDAAVGSATSGLVEQIHTCDKCTVGKPTPAPAAASGADVIGSHSATSSDTLPGQSRIPRLSSTAATTTTPPRQFKRQDTYTKEPSLPTTPTTPTNDATEPKERPGRTDEDERRYRSRQLPETPIMTSDDVTHEASEEENDLEEEECEPEDMLFKPIRNETRIKVEPSKEMRAALKVLDDHLQKKQPLPSSNVPQQLRNAFSIVQLEWFKVSSTKSADPLEVEDYLDYFEDKSTRLLEYIINMTDNSGNTAMHYAVSHGNFDVVSILLDSKVLHLDVMNTAGYTSVMLVSLAQIRSETHRHVVRRLFHLCDVNTRAKQHGQTALMLAVSHGRLDTVRLLLEAGADVNIQDEDGSTALMCAAEHGHIDIVKLLLTQSDCDVSVVDHDGSTALSIAMEAGHRDIGVLLYAQEHFTRGSSPYGSLRGRRARSVTPTMRVAGAAAATGAPSGVAAGAAGPPCTPPPTRRTPKP